MMNIKIENHEYNLRQFIDMASRWDINVIYKSQSPTRPFGIMNHYVIKSREFFEEFRNQLRLEFDKQENAKGFEIDIRDRFLLDINRYYNWHKINKSNIEKLFGDPNLYSLMLGIMEMTEREINKYYPQQKKDEGVLKKNYKETIWFKVGILFATGKMEKLIQEFDSKPRDISTHLKNPSYEKYILASINDYKKTNTDKNIFYNRDKMLKIINHCKNEDIKIKPSFTERLPPE